MSTILGDILVVSIPHSGLAPFRHMQEWYDKYYFTSFNPSFGLSAIPTFSAIQANHPISSFNPSFGLSAIPTEAALEQAYGLLSFNPSFGLSAIPTITWLD